MKSSSTHASSSPKRRQDSNTPETEQAIRMRAYELFELRGKEDGHDLDDWLQAEFELAPQRAHKVAA